VQGIVTEYFRAHDLIHACKVQNQQRRMAAPKSVDLSAEGLGAEALGDLSRALFDSVMQTQGYRPKDVCMAKGFAAFQQLFVARGKECWWPASLAPVDEHVSAGASVSPASIQLTSRPLELP
jgi:hypothetical protein